MRRCACPCNQPLPPDAPENQVYFDANGVHKQRAYRAKKKAEAERSARLMEGVREIRRRGRVTVRGRRRAGRYTTA